MKIHSEIAFRPAVTGICAAIVILGFLYIYGFGVERFRPETVRDLILSQGQWGPAAYIFANVVRPFAFFPAVVLGVAGGLAFGPFWGTVYLVIGTVIGAVVSFGLARLAGPDMLARLLPKRAWTRRLDERIAGDGFRVMLVLRLVPLLPWDAVSFMAGLSKVRFWPYFAATFIGSIPGAIAFSYLGDTLAQSLAATILVAAVIAVVTLYLPAIYYWVTDRKD